MEAETVAGGVMVAEVVEVVEKVEEEEEMVAEVAQEDHKQSDRSLADETETPRTP